MASHDERAHEEAAELAALIPLEPDVAPDPIVRASSVVFAIELELANNQPAEAELDGADTSESGPVLAAPIVLSDDVSGATVSDVSGVTSSATSGEALVQKAPAGSGGDSAELTAAIKGGVKGDLTLELTGQAEGETLSGSPAPAPQETANVVDEGEVRELREAASTRAPERAEVDVSSYEPDVELQSSAAPSLTVTAESNEAGLIVAPLEARATEPTTTASSDQQPRDGAEHDLHDERPDVEDHGARWTLLRDARGNTTTRVRLDHPTLGPLQLDFAMNDETVDIRVVASTLLSAVRLERDAGSIRRLIGERGGRMAVLRVERHGQNEHVRSVEPGRLSMDA